MEPYTKTSIWDGKRRKYPVTSAITGNTYEVVIHPYGGMDDNQYSEGCVVTLKRKGLLRSKELYENLFDNDNGKIVMKHWSTDNKTKTEFNYNLIDMAGLIVQLYETKNKKQINSTKQLDKDFAEFSKWDGVVM